MLITKTWLIGHVQIKFLKDKSFEIASDPKYDGYRRGLASMVYKFFD